MRNDVERIKDIAEAIAAIERYAVRGRDAFEKDELIQTWIIHHLLILGEATARITGDFRERHADIPWSQIIGMRNVLVHDYFAVDFDVVWRVVECELPRLKEALDIR